jgi:hypothetical protein
MSLPRVVALVLLIWAEVACSTEARTDATRPRTGPPQDESFSELRVRGLRLPRASTGTCPVSGAIRLPGIPAEAGLGPGTTTESLTRGPIYTVFPGIPRALDFFSPPERGWRSATILVVSRPSYRGPVLVRGRCLDGPGRIRFDRYLPRPFALRLPSGPWDEGPPPVLVWDRAVHPEPGWRAAVAEILVRQGGCHGLQIDGVSFSYEIVFFAIRQD